MTVLRAMVLFALALGVLSVQPPAGVPASRGAPPPPAAKKANSTGEIHLAVAKKAVAITEAKKTDATKVATKAEVKKDVAATEAKKADATTAVAAAVPSSGPRRQTLRVCNAFPGDLHAWHDDGDSQHDALTDRDPIVAKTCRDFDRETETGDFLELRVPGARAPLYVPIAPVRSDSVGLIVVYAKAKDKAGVWEHYFDHLAHPQVAVVDVTAPGATGKVDLACGDGECVKGEKEELAADSVRPVKVGHYAVAVPGGKVTSELEARPGGSYVVLLTGPGEVVIYPPSAGSMPLQSGAAATTFGLAALMAAAAAL